MTHLITNNKDYSHLCNFDINSMCFILSVLGSSIALVQDGKVVISTMLVRGVTN